MSENVEEASQGEMFISAVREHAGEAGVAAVRRARGGVSVWIPVSLADERHWLAQCIGLTPAERVCQAMRVRDADGRPIGRLRLRIPLGEESTTARARAVFDSLLIDQGLSVRGAALQSGLSERGAFRRKAQLVAAGKIRGGI